MKKLIKQFYRDEDGAVTVDWVVLTAAVVGLATTIVYVLVDGSVGVTAGVEEFMTGYEF